MLDCMYILYRAPFSAAFITMSLVIIVRGDYLGLAGLSLLSHGSYLSCGWCKDMEVVMMTVFFIYIFYIYLHDTFYFILYWPAQ
jgi:hypothetical protein